MRHFELDAEFHCSVEMVCTRVGLEGTNNLHDQVAQVPRALASAALLSLPQPTSMGSRGVSHNRGETSGLLYP